MSYENHIKSTFLWCFTPQTAKEHSKRNLKTFSRYHGFRGNA
jgi:hypothetical protein